MLTSEERAQIEYLLDTYREIVFEINDHPGFGDARSDSGEMTICLVKVPRGAKPRAKPYELIILREPAGVVYENDYATLDEIDQKHPYDFRKFSPQGEREGSSQAK